MPEATFLHIQTCENTSPRVVELTGSPLRVGRGPQCDVRLDDPSLGDVQCELTRRGASWRIQPIGPAGRISIEGVPVEQPCPLPLGVTVRVGSARLTLRGAVALDASSNGFEIPLPAEHEVILSTNVPPAEPASWTGHGWGNNAERNTTPGASNPAMEEEADRLERWRARLATRERSLRNRAKELRWEARWRAVGEDLRAREAPPAEVPPRGAPTARRKPAPEAAPQHAEPDVEADTDAPEQGVVPFSFPFALRPEPLEPIEPEAAPPSPAQAQDDPHEPPGAEPTVDRTAVFRQLFESLGTLGNVQAVPATADDLAATGSEVVESPPVPSPEPEAPEIDPRPREAIAHEPERPPDAAGEAVDEGDGEAEAESDAVGDREQDGPHPTQAQAQAQAQTSESGFHLPSVRDVLGGAAPPRAPTSERGRRGRSGARPAPTVGVAPESWALPGWFAAPVVVGLALTLGLGSLRLAWTWASEQAAFAGVANTLLGDAPLPATPIEPPEPSEPRWWASNPRFLLMNALLRARGGPGAGSPEEIEALVGSARRISPLDPAVQMSHLALGDVDGDAPPSVSRDVLALHQHGNRLREQDRIEEAVRAFGDALAIAIQSNPDDAEPEFLEDPRVRRFALPLEGRVREIVRDLLATCRETPERWQEALAPSPLAALVAYRTLSVERDPGSSLARALVLEAEAPADDDPQGALDVAAKAELLALDGQLAEAEALYRDALARAPSEPTRRLLAFNLSEIQSRLGDHAAMVKSWDLARSEQLHDPINTRLAEARLRHTRDRAPSLSRLSGSRASVDDAVRPARFGIGPGTAPGP